LSGPFRFSLFAGDEAGGSSVFATNFIEGLARNSFEFVAQDCFDCGTPPGKVAGLVAEPADQCACDYLQDCDSDDGRAVSRKSGLGDGRRVALREWGDTPASGLRSVATYDRGKLLHVISSLATAI
jgi:hypothetical protein